MPTINRVVYFAQSGTVRTVGTGGSYGPSYLLPISSANIEVSRPIEAITSFGKFSSLNTAQTNLTTCKSTLKAYLGTGIALGTGSSVALGSGIDAAALNALINATSSSSGIEISVMPGGFVMTGILTNLGIDMSMGGFATVDLGFAGIGKPTLYGPTSNVVSESNGTMSIAPITTISIGTGGAMSGTYASSIKFSYDLPTDTLSALGDDPNASQGSNRLISSMASKPPYKATVSVEGHGVDPTRTDTLSALVYNIGNIGIQLPNAKVSSRSMNNAAGQVSATYSFTAEDVGATITSVQLTSFDPTQAAALPTYGA